MPRSNTQYQRVREDDGCMDPPNKNIQSFNAIVEDFLGDEDRVLLLIGPIERWLWQFRLVGNIGVDEVVSEAYIRAIAYLHRGNVIKNPQAWLKSTSYNIIREISREKNRQIASDPQSNLFENMVSPCDSEQGGGKFFELLTEGFLEDVLRDFEDSTDPELVQLIRMRRIENLSWQEIREQLIQFKGTAPKETTLRKRFSRVFDKLKEFCERKYSDL